MALTHRQLSERLLLVYLAILLFCLVVGQTLILTLVLGAVLLALFALGDVQASWRVHLYLVGFIVLGVLPLAWTMGQGGDADAYLRLGAWQLGSDSLSLALRVGLRAWTCSLLVRLMLLQIPVYRLCQILRSWSVPRLLVELIELSYRYIHLLLGQSERIYEAQRLRLGYGSWRARYRHTGQLFARSFILAYDEGENLYEGLLSRQFNEEVNSTHSLAPQTLEQTEGESLRLEDIHYRYKGGEREALRGLSLSITRGERIVLLGANGAGKSTLMHIISGLRREGAGQLYLNAKPLDKSDQSLREQRRHIALVMQNANHQLFCPSVEDEIAFGLRNSGLPEEELAQRVEEIITTYDLEELRSKAPHLLSEGQKKWVSLAAMMALRPDIILMDEPTACLDCAYTERIMALVEGFCREGRSVILSTHDMNLAYAWAERALVLSEGQLIYDGSVQGLFDDEELIRRARLRQPYGYKPQPKARRGADDDYRIGLFHNVVSLTTLIVGGGKGAERKAQTLSQAGVSWRVLAPELNPQLAELVREGKGVWHRGTYPSAEASSLLAQSQLCIAATGIGSVDAELCQEAMRLGRLAVALSDPLEGNVQFAAQGVHQGLHIALHSRYRLPELTREVRDLALQSLEGVKAEDLERLSQLRQQAKDEAYTAERDKILAQIRYDWTDRR